MGSKASRAVVSLRDTLTGLHRHDFVVGLIQTIRLRVLTLPRRVKQAAMMVSDAVSYAASAVVSYWLVFGTLEFSPPVLAISTLAVIIAIPSHWIFGLYASIVRYMGLALLAVGVRSTLLVSVVLMTVSAYAGFTSAPIRMGIVFWSFSLILIVGGRVAARMFLTRRNSSREPVIIYGAGHAGAQLIASLYSGDDYFPVALVDDDRNLHGKRVHGQKVLSPDRLEEIIATTKATGVLLAMPSSSRRSRRQVLERLSLFPIRVQTMPEFKNIVSGKARLDDLQDVEVKDLLGRDPVAPNTQLLAASITGKNVMITGAGGSIGSELCRQILRLSPKRLVCFEISEAALYNVDKELTKFAKWSKSRCEIVALLGSVHHEKRMREAIEVFEIQSIYHAAAYKHVPIVEHNLFEGIHNNVFGTLHTLRAAADAGVESFVLISTDKAVNPTNVMGATKRMAELILQAFDQQRSKGMRVCMVRFGNVLESSGSVVPLFREQIRHGGPVTITHRDIIRYFMTIPEAAQLVIQSAAMAQGGDVFVLDMGKPVRIEDLAHRMINLMGLTVCSQSNPEGDIEIEYIGLRPGEKLYEELLIGTNVSGTEHPRIMRADEDFLPHNVLAGLLDELRAASSKLDYKAAREILLRAVTEYAPENGIDDLIWARKTGTDLLANVPTVIKFPRPHR